MFMYNYGVAPNSAADLSGIFKMVWVGSNGVILRTMHNNMNAICTDGNSVKTKAVSASDSGFSSADTALWQVERVDANTNRYCLTQVIGGTKKYLTAVTGWADWNKSLEMKDAKTAAAEFVIDGYTGAAIESVDFRFKASQIVNVGSTINFGNTNTCVYAFYSTTIGRNGGTLSYSFVVSGSSVSLATMNSSTGVLTASKPGKVRVLIYYASVDTGRLVDIYITPTSGEYYMIQNDASLKFMQATDGGGLTDSVNNNVYNSYNLFELIQPIPGVSSSAYQIKNVATGKYLTAPPNDNSTSVSLMNKLPDIVGTLGALPNPRQTWTVTFNASGTINVAQSVNLYNFLHRDGSYKMASPVYSTFPTYIVKFNMLKAGGDVVMLGIEAGSGHDHGPIAFPSAAKSLLAKGWSYTMLYELEVNKATAMQMLNNSRIFISISHAGPTSIQLTHSSSYQELTVDDINSLSLTRLELAFFNGCSTGGTIVGDNLLQVIANKKPNAAAVGFTRTNMCPFCSYWSNYFFEYLADGKNVSQAVSKTNAKLITSWSGTYAGNGSYTL